ncbi:MAG TPA: hypothetical protein VE076_02860 [Nitrososphaeraceae archaeon]|jgi:hypothetical protein|nr:hypothetical protein [Nitrososphaeraceae archaeon]
MIHSGNTRVKIVEPNKGKHIGISGDINTIVASKEDTGGTYSFIEANVFQEQVLFHTFKHVKMKGFT